MLTDLKNKFYYQFKYNLKCYFFLPITFFRRIVFGKNNLARRFFFDKWGVLPKKLFQTTSQGKNIWIIANSGGELLEAVHFMDELKKSFPEYKLVLSTESYDTFQHAKTLTSVDFVFFPPWDISFICEKSLKKIKPSILIFIEHCYFPVLSKKAKDLGVKTLVCSAMINNKLLKGYFLMQRSYALRFYKYIDKFAVKSEDDFKNLIDLGVDRKNIDIMGDLKYDLEHLLLSENEKNDLKMNLHLSSDDLIFIVGSFHNEEADIILQSFSKLRKNFSKLKLIIAPRWLHDIPPLENRIKECGFTFKRKSQLKTENFDPYNILIIDTFGELRRLYGIASVVFIGSSIVPMNVRHLGHNMHEPLVHGVPILFGSHMGLWENYTKQFKEICPECEVKDSASLADSMSKILTNDNIRKKLRNKAISLTESNNGITQKYIEFLQNYLCVSS